MPKTVAERLAENRKKRAMAEIQTEQLEGSSVAERLAKNRQKRLISADTIDADLKSLNESLSSTFGGWQDAETLKNTKSSLESMVGRLDAYKQYLTGRADEDTLSQISSIHDDYSKVLEGFDQYTESYGKYSSADAWNRVIKEAEAARELYEAAKNSEQGKQGWEKYLSDQANSGKEATPLWQQMILRSFATSNDNPVNMAFNNAVYDYKNDDSYRMPTDDWTEDQKDIFGYLYMTSPARAFQYAEATNNSNNLAEEEEAIRKIAESATSNFWAGAGHTVGSIATAPFGLADYLNCLAMIAAGRPITSDGFVSPFEYSQAVKGGITEHLNKEIGTFDEDLWLVGGKGVGDLYGLGTSIAQSLSSAYTLGPGGTLVSYFGQGAAAGVDEALARGATDWQAALYGTALGAFEAIAESIGIDNLFKLGSATTIKGFLKNVLKQAGAEGMEEGLTSLLSNIADNAIMQDKSKFNFLVAQYMADGMSESEAKRKAWLSIIGDVAFDTIAGSASGGISGGVHTAVRNIASNIDAKKIYRDNAAELVAEALEINPSDAYALEMKALLDEGKTLTGGQINRLVEGNEKILRGQESVEMKTAEDARITELGDTGDVGTERINEKEYNKELYSFAEDVAGVEKNAAIAPQTFAPQTQTLSVTENASKKENAAEGKFEASADGKTRVGDTEISIKEVASIKDGEMMLQLEDGSTVKASDVEFGSSDEALLYENVLDMGLNAASANAFLNGYDGKLSAEIYARGFREAYMYGEYGFPMSEISTEGFLPDLTEVQRHLAYNLGKANAEAKAEREDASLKGAVEKAKAATETGATVKKGGVRFEAGVRPKTAAQKHTVRLAKHLAKALGIDIVFYDATLEGAKNTKDNGYYDPNDDSIHLDFQNARDDAKTIVFTLSHELVHFIKKWSPAKFKTFADFLMEQYAARGVSASELLQNKMAALGTTDADLAYEEIIADACERMLLDSDAVVKLMELRKADLDLFEKIKLHVLEILDKLRAVFNGVDPNTRGGVALQNMVDVLDQIHAMFEDAAVDAAKTYQAVQESGSEGLVTKRQAKPSKTDPRYLDPRTVTEADVTEMLENVTYGVYDDGTYIPLRRNTPKFFIDVVKEHSKGTRFIEDYPIAATVEHLRQNMEEVDGQSYGKARPHEFSVDDVITMTKKMGDPSYIILQKNNRYAEVVSFYSGRNNRVIVSIDFADGQTDPRKKHNYKYPQYMNGYEGGYYNIVVTQYEPDDFQKYLNDNEVVYDKKEMNGKYQVGSGRIVTVTHDTPFIEDIIPQDPDSVKRENIDGEKSQKKTVSDRTFSDELESVVQETGNEKLAIKRQAKKTSRIAFGMTDSERADVLREETIAPKDIEVVEDGGFDWDALEKNRKSAVEKPLIEKLRDLGYLRAYTTDSIDVEFEFTGGGLRKSLSSQVEYYGGSLADLTKVVMNMQVLLDNSVLIEIHKDKAIGTPKENARLVQVYVLLSAYKENGNIIPVQFEVKQYVDNKNRLYLAVALTKIEASVLDDTVLPNEERTRLIPTSVYSIPRLIEKINPKDENFFKYIPDEFLNEAQKRAKSIALEKEAKKYGRVVETNDEIYSQKKTVTNRTLLADALESTVKDEVERKRLGEYKAAIAEIEAAQEQLTELRAKIKELSFAKGPRDTKAINALRFEANKLANRISVLDGRLLRLESMGAIKKVLEREKARAYEKAKQEGKEALATYREKAEQKQRDLAARYQESRKKGVEGRSKTEMRHKIKSIVSELNQLLLHGSKERNVKPALRSAVASALEAVNMDTLEVEKRIAELNSSIEKATDPVVAEALIEKRDRIQKQGDTLSVRLADLKAAYEQIKAKPESEIDGQLSLDADIIIAKVESVSELIGDTPIRSMTLFQLEAVYDMYRMVLKTIQNVNKVFRAGKEEGLLLNVKAVEKELSAIPKLKEERLAEASKLEAYSWNELMPVYAFERIGSATFKKFYWDFIKAQNVYAVDGEEAKAFAEDVRKKYNYASWDMNKVYEFPLADGRTLRATLKHMLSIYAYSKREQALEHMAQGGFFFDDKETFTTTLGGVLKFNKSNEVGYQIDAETLGAIKEAMSKEQLQYVDEMQAYLSEVMADKGNAVSRVLWGIDIFKEKVYFPLKSKEDFLKRANETAANISLKNDGMTKETVPGASNPIVLEAFDEVWAGHVERMAQYHAFVLPIDNMNKVHQYGTWNGASISISTMLGSRHGSAVNDYIRQFIKDMNGSVMSGGVKAPGIEMFNKFKKTAVAASLSVVVQQPTAIIRATALIDPKYFLGSKVKSSDGKDLEEMRKYAPISVLKEIGGFDAGSGRTLVDYINGDTKRGVDKAMAVIDDISMKGAELGDRVGWLTIWNAVKREVASKNKGIATSSEQFLSLVGERFTEVIVYTQVYDSTLSRSAFMRSKRDLTKMMTSFMGEPTLSYNMMANALYQLKRHTMKKSQAARTISSVLVSTTLASLAASFIYGLRDDDDEKTLLEKWLSAFGMDMLGVVDINGFKIPLVASNLLPHNMLPWFRDAVSLLEGWDVERADMSVLADVWKAIDGLDSEKKSAWRKVEDMASIASMFGTPLKNAMRTFREMYNLLNGIVG